MFAKLFKFHSYELLDNTQMINADVETKEEPTCMSMHDDLKADEYVYIEMNDGVHGFIINRFKARKIISILEMKIGSEKLHNPLNRDKICYILHKRSVLDLTHDEWKAMGSNKPKRARW